MARNLQVSRSSKRRLLAALLLGVGALAALALVFGERLHGARARWRFPRVVVVTLDTLHVLYTGPYNENIDYTPTLDRFAASGVTFDHAYTTVPITMPSHASLFTGRRPVEIGVMVNNDTLTAPVPTLAEEFRRAGYRTGAVISLGVLKASFNLARGFEHYADDLHGEWERWYATADEVVAAARGWVEEVAAEPFFLWLHLSDPHEPYLAKGAPPDVGLELDGRQHSEWTLTTKENYRVELELSPGRHELAWVPLRQPRPDDGANTALVLERAELESAELAPLPAKLAEEVRLVEPYRVELDNPSAGPVTVTVAFRGRTNAPPRSEVFENYMVEIAYADRWLGEFERFLDERGLAEDTLWVVVSDHGEGLYHHSAVGHATYTQEDQLRILWLLKGPGVPAGRRISGEPVLIDDVLPTVLEQVGLPVPEGLSGRSQTGCWGGGGCARRDEWWAYGASVHDEQITALAGYRWPYKLLWQGFDRRSGVFDVTQDPLEETELGRIYRQEGQPEPPEFDHLVQQVERHRGTLQRALEERGAEEPSAEQEEMLRALGYID